MAPMLTKPNLQVCESMNAHREDNAIYTAHGAQALSGASNTQQAAHQALQHSRGPESHSYLRNCHNKLQRQGKNEMLSRAQRTSQCDIYSISLAHNEPT
jgi:hypothetical protein